MADDEDDYLSDKFLVEPAPTSSTKTYAQIRKEAQRQAKLKNEQNKLKSRRLRELESREEGLSKSLFERAKEEEDAGVSSGNKALSIMMKMGFKPGQSLGKVDDGDSKVKSTSLVEISESQDLVEQPQAETASPSVAEDTPTDTKIRHKVEPLPLNEWAGKKGIGLGKRARSPTSSERVAKMAKMADEASHTNFRDRARQEYEERHAEGRLGPAQRTCITLDEKAGKSFNVLWLDPKDPDSFPEGLMDTLSLQTTLVTTPSYYGRQNDPIEVRLRRQMQADALQPLTSERGDESLATRKSHIAESDFPPEIIQETVQFLQLQAQDRLQLVLAYLRDRYAYCFWCGTQYDDENEMEAQCPGADEEAHD